MVNTNFCPYNQYFHHKTIKEHKNDKRLINLVTGPNFLRQEKRQIPTPTTQFNTQSPIFILFHEKNIITIEYQRVSIKQQRFHF